MGIVLECYHGYHVVAEKDGAGRRWLCRLSNLFRKDPTLLRKRAQARRSRRKYAGARRYVAEDDSGGVVVGDLVGFEPGGDGRGLITAVLPRRNLLCRVRPGTAAAEDRLASNLDAVFLVVAHDRPAPDLTFVDGVLCAAWRSGVECVMVFNKKDLETAGSRALVTLYSSLGYRILETDALHEGAGRLVESGRLEGAVLFLGPSGVGKSTLVAALTGDEYVPVGEVSEKTGRGRHTTTFMRSYFAGETRIVDSPGLCEFRPVPFQAAELADAFPEMRGLRKLCRFTSDCLHLDEPGCEVKRRVLDGVIDSRRYDSYRRMAEDFRRFEKERYRYVK